MLRPWASSGRRERRLVGGGSTLHSPTPLILLHPTPYIVLLHPLPLSPYPLHRWGEEGSLACLGEGEALLCLLSALTAEKGNAGAKVGCQEMNVSKCGHLTSSRVLC